VLVGLDLDGAVTAGGGDELPYGPAGLVLDPAADGQGGEDDGQVGLDRVARVAFSFSSRLSSWCAGCGGRGRGGTGWAARRGARWSASRFPRGLRLNHAGTLGARGSPGDLRRCGGGLPVVDEVVVTGHRSRHDDVSYDIQEGPRRSSRPMLTSVSFYVRSAARDAGPLAGTCFSGR
jgi:hypothetical protein